MSRFAFSVSIEDMIRKLRYRYDDPLDYVESLVSLSYAPGENVDIHCRDESIAIDASGSIPADVMANAEKQRILSVAAVLPPTPLYSSVIMQSTTGGIQIDSERNITVLPPINEGTSFRIHRENPGNDGEQKLFRKFYSQSDMRVSLDGEVISKTDSAPMPFSFDSFSGTICYDPNSQGGIHFYQKGRFVSHLPEVPAVDIRLYDHPFSSTITKSKMITRGRSAKDFSRLQMQLPGILFEYLNSSQAAQIRERSNASYQTLLRVALAAYPNNRELREKVLSHYVPLHENERMLVDDGKLGVIARGLGVRGVIPRPNTTHPEYDNENNLLWVPADQVETEDPYVLAGKLVPLIASGKKRQLIYKQLATMIRD